MEATSGTEAIEVVTLEIGMSGEARSTVAVVGMEVMASGMAEPVSSRNIFSRNRSTLSSRHSR